ALAGKVVLLKTRTGEALALTSGSNFNELSINLNKANYTGFGISDRRYSEAQRKAYLQQGDSIDESDPKSPKNPVTDRQRNDELTAFAATFSTF
ncbi:MAG TPA: hypothetical protein VFK03_02095, partial [Candidatus Saccharimonadales bacterium]|nr:hypothetical protein [Candidatus Saccharimonadales bacterium]